MITCLINKQERLSLHSLTVNPSNYAYIFI